MTGTVKDVGHLVGKLSKAQNLKGRLASTQTLKGKMSISASAAEVYGGDYDVVPTQYEQVLDTRGKMMSRDVTIAKIPNNYGLITWNGSVLTVS